MNISYYFYYKALKFLKCGKISHGGRNFLGRICVHHQGGGQKKNYRLIDFFRRINSFGSVIKLCFDCNRSSLLALVLYDNGLCSFIIAADEIGIKSLVYSGLHDLVVDFDSFKNISG
jgi:large subunit ribosomal protein L2